MIPFWLFPGSWGLKGKTRAIAQAEYELTGYNLEIKVAEIKFNDDPSSLTKALLEIDLKYNKIDRYTYETRIAELEHANNPAELKKAKLTIDFTHNKIDQYTYDQELASLIENESDKELAKLEVDLKHNRVTNQEYERRKADILGEPWIAMPKISWDPDAPSKTYFELDYNDYFIAFLRENNYQGTDEDCVNRWLNDICFSVLEDFNQPDPEFVSPIRKVRLPDGKTEHS